MTWSPASIGLFAMSVLRPTWPNVHASCHPRRGVPIHVCLGSRGSVFVDDGDDAVGIGEVHGGTGDGGDDHGERAIPSPGVVGHDRQVDALLEHPGAKVNVPVAALKSVPAVAVPGTVVHLTVKVVVAGGRWQPTPEPGRRSSADGPADRHQSSSWRVATAVVRSAVMSADPLGTQTRLKLRSGWAATLA